MSEVLGLATMRLRRALEASLHEDPEVAELLDEVVARRLDPASAASAILARGAIDVGDAARPTARRLGCSGAYLIAILVRGRRGGGAADRRPPPARRAERATPTPAPTPTSTPQPAPRDVARSHCPEGVPGCRAVRGTVLYVERVDPDGDGDLHVVVDAGSITLPGMTAIDVAPDLRPRRDPRDRRPGQRRRPRAARLVRPVADPRARVPREAPVRVAALSC